MARSSVFLCGLHHRNLPGPNLKHICVRLCQVWYYFAISVFKKKILCRSIFHLHSVFHSSFTSFCLYHLFSGKTVKMIRNWKWVGFCLKGILVLSIKTNQNLLCSYPSYPIVMGTVHITYGTIGKMYFQKRNTITAAGNVLAKHKLPAQHYPQLVSKDNR